MKITIATIHSAYGLSYVPDGKVIEQELSEAKAPISVVDINWLKPVEDHKYIADMLLQNEIVGLERVESAVQSYLIEQFDESSSRLLWMPSFHKSYSFCEYYLKDKSVFDVSNTIFSKVISETATEIDVLVLHLGNKSLTKLGSPKLLKKNYLIGDMKVHVSGYEVSKKSILHEDLLKNYSLTLLNKEKDLDFNESFINSDVSLEQFSMYGKLETI